MKAGRSLGGGRETRTILPFTSRGRVTRNTLEFTTGSPALVVPASEPPPSYTFLLVLLFSFLFPPIFPTSPLRHPPFFFLSPHCTFFLFNWYLLTDIFSFFFIVRSFPFSHLIPSFTPAFVCTYFSALIFLSSFVCLNRFAFIGMSVCLYARSCVFL